MDKESVKHWKKEFKGRTFSLKKWKPPENNPQWSHDHCELCGKDFPHDEEEAYTDKDTFYWICKSCFNENKKILKL